MSANYPEHPEEHEKTHQNMNDVSCLVLVAEEEKVDGCIHNTENYPGNSKQKQNVTGLNIVCQIYIEEEMDRSDKMHPNNINKS